METGFIYAIKNDINEKVYVGQTSSIRQRWHDHKANVKRANRKSKLYNAIRKIGIEHFYIVELEANVSKDKLCETESKYIELFDSVENGYNTKFRENRIVSIAHFDANEIVELYKNGMTIKNIAKKYHSCKKTISSILKDNGVSIRDWNKEQSNPIICIEFLTKEYIVNKKSIKQIAREVGLSDTAINHWLMKFNLK